MRFTIVIVGAAVMLSGCNQMQRMMRSMTKSSSSSSSASSTPDDPSENMTAPVAGHDAPGAMPAAPAVPVAATPRNPSNLLIGVWTTTDPKCGTLMFGPGAVTMTPPPGATYGGQTIAIDYQVNSPGDVIIIMTNNAKPPKEIVLPDSGHMNFEGCAYTRAA